MFDVHGDTIIFAGHSVGKIDQGWPSLRAMAAEWLREWRDPDAAYEDGHRDGWNECERGENAEVDELRAENDQLAKRVADLETEVDDLQLKLEVAALDV